MIFLASVQDSLSVMFLMPMSEGLSLIVTGEGVGAGGGEGATVVADWDESEDAGTIEPAINDMTDVPLEGRTEDKEPRLAVRDEPRWVRMYLRWVDPPGMERIHSMSLIVKGEMLPALLIPPMAKERGAASASLPSGSGGQHPAHGGPVVTLA